MIEREGHHTSAEDLRDYVMQVIDATAENISSMLQDIRALRHTEIDYITVSYTHLLQPVADASLLCHSHFPL